MYNINTYSKQEKLYCTKLIYSIKALLVLIIILLNNLLSYSQYYYEGTEPFRTRWKQLRIEHYNIIFPEEAEAQAQEAARTILFYDSLVAENIRLKPGQHFPVIVHNQQGLANGFVSIAPRRMELNLIPPPNNYSDIWLKHLIIHELRHVHQFNQLHTKGLHAVFGEQSMGLFAAMIPQWLYEGDAVETETRLTHAGRGRYTNFSMPYYTDINNITKYKFNKYIHGSYNAYVPNYYVLGYQLSTYATNYYGTDIWQKTLGELTRSPFTFRPFSNALKKHSGLSTDELFKRTFQALKSYHDSITKNQCTEQYESPFPSSVKNYAQYKHIKKTGSATYLYIRSDFQENATLYRNMQGQTQRLYAFGHFDNTRLACDLNYAAWTEYKEHVRWKNITYSNLKVLNLSNRIIYTMPENGFYYSPTIANNKIAVIEYDKEGNCFLSVFTLPDLKRLYKVPAPGNKQLQYPVFTSDSSLAVLHINDGFKQLYTCNLTTETWRKISFKTHLSIEDMSYANGKVYFTCPESVSTNIYSFQLAKNELYKHTSAAYGTQGPFVYADTLFFSSYTTVGYRPAKKAVNNAQRIDSLPNQAFYLSSAPPTITKMPDTVYPVMPYRRLSELLNVHSWFPFYISSNFMNMSDIRILPGITLLSQNILSTSVSTLGLGFNGGFFTEPSFTYRGFLPVIQLSYHSNTDKLYQPFEAQPNYNSYNRYLSVNSYIPLSQVVRNYQLGSTIGATYSYRIDKGYRSGGYHAMAEYLQLYWLKLRAAKHTYPQLGQLFYIRFNHSINSRLYSNKLLFTGTQYLPGLIRSHSLRIGYTFEQQALKNQLLLYTQQSRSARGYNPVTPIRFEKYSIDYTLPLGYPDVGLSFFAYVKQIKLNAFFDYETNELKYLDENYRLMHTQWLNRYSAGVDLLFECYFARLLFPFETGVRGYYLFNYQRFGLSLIFSVNIG